MPKSLDEVNLFSQQVMEFSVLNMRLLEIKEKVEHSMVENYLFSGGNNIW